MKPEDTVNAEILEGLSGAERESFQEGLRALGMDPAPVGGQALREAVKRLRPDFTEQQLDTFVYGEVNPTSEFPNITEALVDEDWENFIAQIANAYRELNTGMSEEDVAKWTADNEERVKAKGEEADMAPFTVAHFVSAVLQDEKDEAERQEIPDALKARYPDWSDQKRATWLNDHEPLLLAYKGLHPEWSGEQLIGAVDD